MVVRWKFGIRTWLLLLTTFTVLPVCLFSGFAAYQTALSQQKSVETALVQRTEASAHAIAQRLSVALGALNALALSDAAQQGDLQRLYDYARRVHSRYPDVLAITLIGVKGEQIFNTLRPFGEIHPLTADVDAARLVIETGQPAVSGPFRGTISNQMAASIGVPIAIKGGETFCLRMAVRTASFGRVLDEQHLPADWTAVLFDNAGTTIARTLAPDSSVGVKVSDTLLAALRANNQGVFESLTREGVPNQTAMVRIPTWDWIVAIGVPTESLDAPVRRTMITLAAGGLSFLALSLAAAIFLARRLAGDVGRVSAASLAIGEGRSLEIPFTTIRELDEVGNALSAARERERQAAIALQTAMGAHRQVSQALDQAQRDHLTGLAGRPLFLELAESLRAKCGSGELRMALLFIDLNGFKQINDTFGHQKGDEVLTRTAAVLRTVLRDADVAGRLGGDEFVVCAIAPKDVIADTAQSIARRIVGGVREIGDGIGCSIGVAICPIDCRDLHCAMHRADEAMYEAKRSGKNRFVVYGAPKIDETPWHSDSSTCSC